MDKVMVTSTLGQVRQVVERPQVARKPRKPRHQFAVSFRPWQIQPFMIAPVLPGETMENLLCQCQLRSDPLKSESVGWWVEQMFFYVKHRDLLQRDIVTNMHLDTATNVSTLRSASASVQNYEFSGGMSWVAMCMQVIIAEYFRDEGEGVAPVEGGSALARINNESWLDSVKLTEAVVDDEAQLLPGQVEYSPLDEPAAFAGYREQWEQMRALKIYAKSFEDYLEAQGVTPPREVRVDDTHRPELLRHIRTWTYPQMKYSPAIAAAAPMLHENISERADKNRFFAEPGFIVGVAVVRPKVYLGNLRGAAVGLMDNAYTWLPSVLWDQPWTSLVKVAADAGPINPTGDEEYWVDIKDLFIHGDQFVGGYAADNADPGDFTTQVDPASEAGIVVQQPVITAGTPGSMKWMYPSAADMKAPFKTAAVGRVMLEGVVSLDILSRVAEDTSL